MQAWSQAHGQVETGRHGERQQGAEAGAHRRTDHTQAADNGFYNQLRSESSQGLHFRRNCRAGLAQGVDEDSVCLLHGEAAPQSGAGSEQANLGLSFLSLLKYRCYEGWMR